MNAFIIQGRDRPGEIARVAEAIAQSGVNITNAACVTWGSSGAMAVLTNDDAGARKALAGLGNEFREVELVPCSLDDRPGTLAEASRKLADAGINVELVLPIGMSGGKVSVAFGTDDPAKTRTTLGAIVMAPA